MLQVLLQQCFTTICAGGGGIPVVVEAKSGLSWRRYGVEAVIDKVCLPPPSSAASSHRLSLHPGQSLPRACSSRPRMAPTHLQSCIHTSCSA